MSRKADAAQSTDGMVSMLVPGRVRLTVRVPATSANLGPGFDCMGVALTVFNEMTVETGQPFAVEVHGEAADVLPADRSNAVVAAMDALLGQVGAARVPSDWRVVLHNRIPVGSGLGSSASAIVGGLLLANGLLEVYEPEKALRRDELLAIAVAMEGHPDNVTPALLGGLCLTLPGEAPHTLKLPVPPSLRFVVAVPSFRLYTEDSRRVVPAMVAREDAVFNVAQAARLTYALCSGDLASLRDGFGDRLHEPYRQTLIPGYAAVSRAAVAAGALITTLSGAGPSMLAWCDGDAVAYGVARTMAETWQAHGVPARTFVYRACEEETVVVREAI
ncbi:homoserine kinase [Alicyclobacillus cellulosilyticus]|uniref:Homoserine kinase n=1 Tax=Alicyclobacillus cellulosilyticus TaxID=1003997 RepID=A0A917NJB0_9BACL|nr:homoserine kinase [Alicyclobacillus cellulosilyticus]GGJ05103.1 homoserine kinase [Alicyclobacillus cellulosilyticus]